MPRTSTKTTSGTAAKAKPLHVRLMDGFTVKSRADQTVHTVKNADGATVAEVCVGKAKTRLNLRAVPGSKAPKAIKLDGRSKSWPGGGVVVVEGNLSAARDLLAFVAGKATKSTAKPSTKSKATADDAAADVAAAKAEREAEAARIAELSKQGATA